MERERLIDGFQTVRAAFSAGGDMSIGRSSLKLFVSQTGRALLLFVGIVYFARRLPPDQLGSFFLFQSILGLLTIPADLGVRGALEKRLSEGDDPATTFGSAVALKLLLFAVVSVGILLLRPQLNQYLGAELAIPLIAALATHEMWELYVRTLRGELRVGETAAIRLGLRVIWVGTGAYLLTLGFGPEGLVFGLILGGAIAGVWGAVVTDVPVGRPTVERVRSLIAYSKYQAITSIGGRMYQYMDLAIIGFFLTQRHASAYEVAWQVTLLVLLASKSIAWSLFPQVSKWDADAAVGKIEDSVSTAIGFAMFASIPAFIGGAVFANDILHYFFGSEYTIAAAVLVILLAEKVFQSFNDIMESSVRALNRPDLAARATVASVGVNLVLNPLLIVSIGFVGAAIATTLSWLLNTAMHTRALQGLVTVDFPFRLLGWYTFASVVMGGALVLLKAHVPVTGVPTLLAEIGIGVVIYLAITAAVPEIRDKVILPGVHVLV